MIGFYYRESNERSVNASKKLKELLSDSGIAFCDLEEDSKINKNLDISLLIVFGGDGSVLRASKIALDKIPIVAINTGNVGFLTSYEENSLEKLVQDIKNYKLRFSKRRFMKVVYNGKKYYALNDAVVTKNYGKDLASECIKLHFSIDGEFVDTYVADGLIVSTPTGSTAYALSAGAPIVTPRVDAFLAAPICAHTLHSRPIVYSTKAKSYITVAKDTKECALYIDGALVDVVGAGESIAIEKSDMCVQICEYAENFFEKLSRKLNIWSTHEIPKV